MADDQSPSFHPIAPRVKGTDGRPKPHVGPSKSDYEQHHAKTVGPQSDEWWAKVRLPAESISFVNHTPVDGTRDPLLGQAFCHSALRQLHKRRHCLVPGGRSQRILQLRRQMGLQKSRQGS